MKPSDSNNQMNGANGDLNRDISQTHKQG